MAHSVEGRYPFLDHHFVEFCCGLPPNLKLKGLNEKYILKETFKELIPPEVVNRDKHPYRAPIFQCFSGEHSPAFVKELLSEQQIKKKGYFRADAVKKLMAKGKKGGAVGEIDEMAIAGILSVQLLDELFIKNFTQKVDSYSPIEAKVYRQS
jgi:asparagine synthase (glutamine-hydrolysing)